MIKKIKLIDVEGKLCEYETGMNGVKSIQENNFEGMPVVSIELENNIYREYYGIPFELVTIF